MLRPPIRLLALAAAVLLALGIAACGDDDDATTVTETEVVSTGAETDSTDSTETQQTSTDAVPPPGPGTEGPEFFSTPSGNIGCSVTAQGARCDIGEREWQPTPSSEPCELDYGNGISLGHAGASFTCAGDTALGAPDVLAYGQRAQRGNFFCDSTEQGVTCSDLRNGAGFFISRQSYRIF